MSINNSANCVPVDFDPFAGGELVQTFAATEAQREVWAASQLGPDASCAFNESVSVNLTGAVDEAALERAVQNLYLRHESLQTIFSSDGEHGCVLAASAVPVKHLDFSALSQEKRAHELAALAREEVEQPFDLENGPLFRTTIVRKSPQCVVLILTAHHIVCDGWSMFLLLKELGPLYTAARQGRSAQLPEAQPFSSYARYVARLDDSSVCEYWRKLFAGTVPVVDLPSDNPRPPRRSFASAREDYWFSLENVTKLKQFAVKQRVSFFTLLFAGWVAYIHRITGETSLVTGVPTAGQSSAEMPGVIGHCVNLLPVRAEIDPELSFGVALQYFKQVLLDAFDHQEYTFGRLLRQLPLQRDPSRVPLVPFQFNLDPGTDPKTYGFEGLDIELSINPRTSENFELFLNLVDTGRGVEVQCQYNTALYEAQTVRSWLEGMERLMLSACRNPEQPVAELEIMSEVEQRTIIEDWNQTAAEVPFASPSLAIARQCAITPDAIAAECQGNAITYRVLEAKASQLANYLCRRGVEPNTLVGICVERSLDLLLTCLAIWKTGAAYVPLDPSFPVDRLEYMVQDADIRVLVTQSSLVERIKTSSATRVLLDAEASQIAQESTSGPARTIEPESRAYVIYTSGSTGKPKGVEVHHCAVSNFLASMAVEPGLSASDVIVSVTTLSFDIAVLEFYLPLTVGAKTVIATKEQALDGQALRSLLASSKATLMQATPATWRLLLTAGWDGGGRNFTVLCGGEAFPIDLAQQLCQLAERVFNMYGPTETTVWSTVHRLRGNELVVPIGKPIANTSLYVLDARMRPVPVGVSGELFIGGTGVTRGYLNRPELTSERFLDDPFRPDQKMYRTGDAVRWRRDGVVRFERRVDTQVKVRGFRIELGEIETALSEHPALAQVVVNVYEPRVGDARLVAYCVTRGAGLPPGSELRQLLAKTLPSYMIPQHFMQLDAIPLTPNRKADRKALPRPSLAELECSPELSRGPSTPTERIVYAAFLGALHRVQLDVQADFFLEGGHSLLAAQMVAGLSAKLGRPVPMRTVFENPTVTQLARWIDETGPTEKAVSIPRRAVQGPAPLSLMQERFWYLEQMNPGTALMHTPSAHRLRGKLNESAFAKAFNAMLRRQDVLRTAFRTRPDGSVEQFVREHQDVAIFPAEDLSGLALERREATLNRTLAVEMSRVFDLQNGPLYRVKTYKLGPEEHVLFFMTHHIIWDGWCFDLLYEEMHFHYDAYRKGEEEPRLSALPITYGDFVTWQADWMQRAAVAEQVKYWVDKLRGGPQSLDLPVDKPRPAQQSGRGGAVWTVIPPATMEKVAAVGRSHGSTLYMTLLAVWTIMVSKFSGQSELIVGTPVRGRNLPELEKLMGLFVSALPLRLTVSEAQSFLDNLSAIRKEVVEALGNEDAPFEVIVRALDLKRDESRFPIYQTFFSYQNIADRYNTWGDLERSRIPLFQPSSAQDLAMWFLTNPDGSGWTCLNFNADIFEEETGRRLLNRFIALLERVALYAERAVHELVAPTEAELAELRRWNSTERPELLGGDLVDSLWRGRADFAARRAISQVERVWSYDQLLSRADQIATELLRRGIGRGQVVGLYYERSPEMLAALLGVLRAGAAYLPLDPLFPPERIQFMLEDSQASLVLGDQGVGDLGLASGKTLDSSAVVGDAAATFPSVQPDDVAYFIYTSGSTGKPKGVKVPHRAVVNFLGSMAEKPGLLAHDKLVAVTTLSFDIAVLELLLPLTVGAEIVLAKREQAIDGNALAALLVQSGATCMQATPATWRLLLEMDWQGRAGFKALCGGEALPVELAEGLLGRVEELWNMYGPTETTVWSTCGCVEFGRGGITIGRPIANTTVYIMDPKQQPVPIGAVGEIYIGGEGVALGYHDRQELTDDKFIVDPFSSRPGAKLYKTGDLGRYRNDGELLHLGRTDFQVKVRGYRIELGEIEVALAGVPGIKQAVVVAKSDASGASSLVAYVTLHTGSSLNWPDVRGALRERLPDYMVPSAHVVLDCFPTTPNGKIDRKALPEFHARDADSERRRTDGPRTAAQRLVAEVWMNLLGVSHVSLRDNFLDLGGHSLLVMRAAAQLEARTGKRVGPRSFIFETLEQVASHYADVEQPQVPEAISAAPAPTLGKSSEVRPNAKQKFAGLVARALSNLVRRTE